MVGGSSGTALTTKAREWSPGWVVRLTGWVRAWLETWAAHLAAVTTGLTFLLILLGVYTAASGAGLACSGQWPMCDGGLIPQTIPSLIEWVHRFVAMIAGFFILGAAVGLWVAYDSTRVRAAGALALFTTPVQALLGAGTVFVYRPWVQTVHHGAAMVIFGALLAATLWAFEAERGGADAGSTDDPPVQGDTASLDD